MPEITPLGPNANSTYQLFECGEEGTFPGRGASPEAARLAWEWINSADFEIAIADDIDRNTPFIQPEPTMHRHTPNFTFGPRREPGVYFPPQRGVWLRVVAIVTVFAALGVALVVFLPQL